MLRTILDYAARNPHIRAVLLEGSRANPNAPRDCFQDFDITYLVDTLVPFLESDDWLAVFGRRIMLQKPEAMELFPPEIVGFSYLLLFDDDNKLDLTLVPLDQLEEYRQQSDGLRRVLLDKDGILSSEPLASDEVYHIRRPTAQMFDDCCNEFWNVTPYVLKGLCREELLFAADHLHLVRQELLRMLSWQIGAEHGFGFSLGKHYKWIRRWLAPAVWEALCLTYRMDSIPALFESLLLCHQLFRESACAVAAAFSYVYPPYDAAISDYVRRIARRYGLWKEEQLNA